MIPEHFFGWAGVIQFFLRLITDDESIPHSKVIGRLGMLESEWLGFSRGFCGCSQGLVDFQGD
jgi:hypothetical protein